MADTVDFKSVMAELTVFRNALGEISSSLTNVKDKEILGDLLDQLQNAHSDIEIQYPKAMDMINSTAERVKAEAEQSLAELDQRRSAAEQRIAEIQAARAAIPEMPSSPEAKVDPALGQKLRTELLDQFGAMSGADDAGHSKIREAWQDWD